MKEDNHHQQSSNFPNRRSSYNTWHQNYSSNQKIISYVILLLLTYTLGYFTASFKQQQQQPTVNSPTVVRTATKPTELTAVNNCPSSTSSRVITTDKSSSNDHNKFGSSCKNPVGDELIRSVIIDRVFNGTSPYLNFPPAHVAHLLKLKKIKGWGSYGAVFEKLIKKVRPRTIIEVGTFLGASATHMAELTRRLGLETQIICVDDFRGWPGFRNKVKYVPVINGDVLLYHQFIQNVISLNSSESIIPVPFSTGSALVKLCEWGISAELIEVDAGHDFHSAWSDINLAYKLLKPGGVMFGHDYFTAYDNRGVRRAIDLFARVHGFKVKTDGQHWVLDDQ